MKFEDMPYKRVEYEETEKEYRKIIEDFRKAGSGEEQFKVHERYYALNDRIGTMMTIAHIRKIDSGYPLPIRFRPRQSAYRIL